MSAYAGTNGGRPPPGSTEARFLALEERADETDETIGRVLAAATSAEAQARATHTVVTSLAEGLADFATRVDRRFDALSITATRATLQSLDLGEGDVTAVQSREDIVARAKVAEHRGQSLEEQLAAAEARLAERDRQSDRVRDAARASSDVMIARWKITAGVIVAVVGGALASAQAAVSVFGH